MLTFVSDKVATVPGWSDRRRRLNHSEPDIFTAAHHACCNLTL